LSAPKVRGNGRQLIMLAIVLPFLSCERKSETIVLM